MSKKNKSLQILRLEITQLIRESTIFSGFTTSFSGCVLKVIQLHMGKSPLFRGLSDDEFKIFIGFDKEYWFEANHTASYFETIEEGFRFILEEATIYTYHKSRLLADTNKSINALIDIDFPNGRGKR